MNKIGQRKTLGLMVAQEPYHKRWHYQHWKSASGIFQHVGRRQEITP